MSVWFGKAARLVTEHRAEIKHDVALAAGTFLSAVAVAHGAPLTRDVLVAALVAGGRRLVVAVLTGR